MILRMELAKLSLKDPEGFEMSIPQPTPQGRAISGRLLGYKKASKPEITFRWSELFEDDAIALQSHIYASRGFPLYIETARYRGHCRFLGNNITVTRTGRSRASISLTLTIQSTLDFALTNGVVDYDKLLPEHLK